MKRILSVLLIIFLLVPTGFAAEAEQTSVKSDLISAIGLLESSELGFQPEKYVTNSELARAICIIADRQPGEYAEAAAWLKAEGLTGTVGAEKEAAEADNLVRAMVRILGYKDDNFKKAASGAGLYKNASFKGRYITRAEFAAFVYNALTAEKFTLESFTDDGVTLSKKGNILEDRFNIKRVVGVVSADGSTALHENEEPCRSVNEMRLCGVTVRTDKNTKDFIGRRVEAFLKFDENSESDAELAAIAKYKNTEYRAVSEYIDGATTNRRLVWVDYRTGKQNKKELPSGAEVIYNGKRKGIAGELSKSVFTPPDGEVILIDNDADGKIDAVMVWSYRVYTAETITLGDELIYDKSGNIVDLKNKEYFVYDESGAKISLSDIKEFDVLSVAFGEDDEIYIVRTSGKTASGTYKRIGYSVLIGKDEYSLGAYCDINNASDGDYVKAYLDMYNRAVFIVRRSKYEYGYITKAYYDEIDEKVYVKMYTFGGGVKKLCFAEKATVQSELGKEKFGSGFGSAENLYNSVKNKNELVKYRENSEGLISTILFATSKIGCAPEDSTDDFEAYYGISSGAAISSREAKFLQNMFVSSYFVGDNTKLLSLEGNPEEPEKFRQLSASDLVSDNDYYVKIYDVNEKYEAGIVVIDKVEDWYVKFGSIVESVSETVDESGEECLEISVFNQGEKKVIRTDNKNLQSDSYVADKFYNRGTRISEIGVGDVIFYNENSSGKLASFAVVYKNKPLSEQGFYHTSNYGWGSNYIPNAGMAMTYCRVTKRLNNMIVADIDGPRPIKESAWRNYYICEKGRLYKAELSDVRAGDRIVGLWKWSNLNDVIIYR